MSNILDKLAEGKQLHKRLEELREELKPVASEMGWAVVKAGRKAYEEVFPNAKSYERSYDDRWLFNTDLITLGDDFDVTFIEYGRCGDADETLRCISLQSICSEEKVEEYVSNLKLHWLKRIEDKKREEAKQKQEELEQLEARIKQLKGETK